MTEQRETLEEAKKRIIQENKDKKAEKIRRLKRTPPKDEKYYAFIEDGVATIVETEFNSREAVIIGKHEIGKYMVESGFDAPTESVADDLHKNPQELNRCIRFYKLFPNLDDMWNKSPKGKATSWKYIVNVMLAEKGKPRPERRGPLPEKTEWIICPFCKAHFNRRKAQKE